MPLIGNAVAAEFLRIAAATGRAAHAYLLTGPAQVGKRTLARHFAASLVCAARPHPPANAPDESRDAPSVPTLDLGLEGTLTPVSPERAGPTAAAPEVPCGRCRACAAVARDAHPDVRLVEPESGRRGILIDQIRQLEHAVGLRPYEAQCKVFIITEAETMIPAAANALLKTLEEPPADTYLVMTAGDPSQVLPTIASRCQEVPLRPVPAGEIAGALRQRGVEPARADLLARLAGGRPGWALAALADEAVLATRDERLSTLEQLVAQSPVSRLPAAAGFGDAAEARSALETWLGWWRDALLLRHGCEDLLRNVDRLDRLRQLAPDAAACHRAVRRVQEAREQIDANANVRLAVEALLLELPATSDRGSARP